jgi:hypothetical protein
MLNCKNATRLISESQERTLLMREKMPLKVHVLMCAACNNFRLQIPFLSQAMRSFSQWEGIEATGQPEKPEKPDNLGNQDK